MITLSVYIAVILLSLPLMAWVLALSARLVGSPRGRFLVGLYAALIILGIKVVIGWGGALVFSFGKPEYAPVVTGFILVMAQLGVIFFVLKRVFRCSFGRTFAPFGALILANMMVLVVMLGFIRPFLTEAFRFPTRSMSPTIEIEDRFFVNKIVTPQRWDIVAYWSQDTRPVIYCKRLIGLPGERLRFDHGGIYINDQLVNVPPVLAGRCHASPATISAYQKTRYKDGETIVLGNNDYFVMGDNVDASMDSRETGPFTGSSLIGVVDLIYWPLGHVRIMR